MRNYTPIDNERLIELASEGAGMKQICEELELTPKQVSNALNRLRRTGIYIPEIQRPAKSLATRETARKGYCAIPRRRRGSLAAFSARLDTDILARIKRVARRLEISQAVLVEDAVKHYLELKGL